MRSALRALVSYGALLALVIATPPSRADARLDTTRQTIRRHFTPADRERGRYQYVPFDVPLGVAEMTITYRYDSAAGASVIDLGLIEPGPLTLGSTKFRGYSGGATRTITISATR